MPIAKHKAVFSLYCFLAAIFLTLPATVSASAVTPTELQSGGLLIKQEDSYATAPLLNTDVAITVNGLVARVSVMQEFRNEADSWVEGVYVFPLPDKAAVDHMRLYVGDRLVEGEIREKAEAQAVYEQARQSGKKASLVRQERANLFTTSVANIGPGETIIVEIDYLEDVRYDDGTYSLRYPMTLVPRYTPADVVAAGQEETGTMFPDPADDPALLAPPMVGVSHGHKASIRADVNAGMPLEIIASRYHPVNVSRTNGRYLVSLAGSRVPMDHDFELLWRPVPSSSPRAMVFAETVGGMPHYFIMVVPPSTARLPPVRMPRELIFVVDTSGSMHGASIVQAKQALQRALGELQAGDAFNVVEFNSGTKLLFGSSMPATPPNVSMAQNFVRQLDANGGTEMYPALKFALGSARRQALLRQIVFITDGAVGNEEDLFQLIQQELGESRVFTVGIGSAPNSWFMRKAAEAGRGTFTVIGSPNEVGEKMDRLFQKLEQPQLTDIRVQWPGAAIIESYPDVVPDLYAGEPVILKTRASTAFRPGDRVLISGNAMTGAWSADLSLNFAHQSPGVGALWGRARIGSLLDAERRGADAGTTRDAIVQTALLHHLVSRHTSLVAVDRTPARAPGELLEKKQLASLTPHSQDAFAIAGFPATATDGPLLMRRGMLSLAVALFLLTLLRLERGTGRVYAS